MRNAVRRSLAAAVTVAALSGGTLVATAATAPAAHAGASCAGTQSRTHWHYFGLHYPRERIKLDANTERVVWYLSIPWPTPPYAQDFYYTTLTCFH
jgi:hypothetical protein